MLLLLQPRTHLAFSGLKSTLLGPVLLLHPHPQVLLCRVSVSPFSAQTVFVLRIALMHVQDLAPDLLEVHKVCTKACQGHSGCHPLLPVCQCNEADLLPRVAAIPLCYSSGALLLTCNPAPGCGHLLLALVREGWMDGRSPPPPALV